MLLGCHAEWRHICYDDVEADLRGPTGEFNPSAWQAARKHCAAVVEGLLASQPAPSKRAVLLLDDNMYYRSMRKQWYHFAREHGCTYRQVFLQAAQEVCLERNEGRELASRVPSFSILHMAEAFQWPRAEGEAWEAQPSVTTLLEAGTQSTELQVASFLDGWAAPGRPFWGPPPAAEELGVPDVQSDGHACDLVLRRVVTQAIAHVPQELAPAKSTLAKKWGARKGELVKQLSSTLKAEGVPGDSTSDLIHEMEAAFLRSCVADVQTLLRERERA